MTYDGHVAPGDAPISHNLGNATITKLSVSDMHNNVYIVRDASTGDALLIDAADDWPAIETAISDARTHVTAIATTHRHWDHVRALVQTAHATGAKVIAGADDADDLPLAVDRALRHGDQVHVGELVLDVIHLRGHTPGSIALALRASDGSIHLFTGDSLFPGGVGATNHYDYQSFPQLIDDVEHRVFEVYDDRTWVYPGHGDDTTLAAERPHLQEWRARGW
ncbi:MBL fold metallo-hydrolase [Rudaeicoccus suwonensis]|uniref:Glyoxylase-like metal-dependent hydrolase (Beta-lactamase superfamily II) n=1 Tax=Rudaeicoccus suwonensis TaxID=657409 RepID=A0A561EAN0_9MICO|nr:MBL fold metallo-hydrolase [Rudaeicoccus suwonensis]TWE12664.1 glyoxylase-like metal-dependent hydrolase (beta-lactamase superfamily II) [Rudaeicoccus suwonensis]